MPDLRSSYPDGSLAKQRSNPATATTSNPDIQFRYEVTPDQFCRMVDRAQEYIAAGDIYQVNLAHRIFATVDSDFDSFHLHASLRDRSPAPILPTFR